MRRIIGLLAVLLGAAGVALLAAGGIAVWRTEGVVVDRTDRAAAGASERLAKVEGTLHRLEGKIKAVTVDVEGIRTAVARLVGRAGEDATSRTEVDQLVERLDRLLERSEQLGEALNIVARLFEGAADLTTRFDGNPDRTERLSRVAVALEQAADELGGIRAELAEFRSREAAGDARKLTDLCSRSRGPLERMAGGIASIRQHSVDARESMDHLRREIRFWMRSVAVLLSLVFVWFGLGQVCQIGWGSKRLRSTPGTIAEGNGPGGASE